MHPKMMIALASEAQRNRREERTRADGRSLELADPSGYTTPTRAASAVARRLIAGARLGLRLS
jgi:hypothetical protein